MFSSNWLTFRIHFLLRSNCNFVFFWFFNNLLENGVVFLRFQLGKYCIDFADFIVGHFYVKSKFEKSGDISFCGSFVNFIIVIVLSWQILFKLQFLGSNRVNAFLNGFFWDESNHTYRSEEKKRKLRLVEVPKKKVVKRLLGLTKKAKLRGTD